MASSTRRSDKRAALDVASWMLNVVTSVGIIIISSWPIMGSVLLNRGAVCYDDIDDYNLQVAGFNSGLSLTTSRAAKICCLCKLFNCWDECQSYVEFRWILSVCSLPSEEVFPWFIQSPGPFLDYWLTSKRVDKFDYNGAALFSMISSCTIAVGTNLGQFICIGRFTAGSFQVTAHMKTFLVLFLGFFFFGKEGFNLQVVLGMVLAVIGMTWYGNASSKPGGKECRSHHSTESSELDGKV